MGVSDMAETCKTCKDLLSAGLDLCVRARGLDAQFRRDANLSASVDGEAWVKSGRFDEYVRRHNIHYPDQSIAPKSATDVYKRQPLKTVTGQVVHVPDSAAFDAMDGGEFKTFLDRVQRLCLETYSFNIMGGAQHGREAA